MKRLTLFILLMSFVTVAYSQSASSFFQKGESLQKVGKHQEAIYEFDKAIALDNSNISYYLAKGKSCDALKKRKKSVEVYTKVISLDAKNELAHSRLLVAYNGLRKYEKAADTQVSFSKIVTDATKKEALMTSAFGNYSKAHKSAKSIEVANQVLQLNPKSTDALIHIGTTYNAMEKYSEAVPTLTKAQSLIPKEQAELYSQVSYELGYSYFMQKKYKESNVVVEGINSPKYMRMKMRFTPEYHINKAKAYKKIFLYDEAIESLEFALVIRPNQLRVYRMLEEIAEAQADRTKAIGIQKKVIELTQDNAKKKVSYEKLIDIEFQSAQYDNALVSVNEGLKVFPKDKHLALMKGLILYKMKKNAEAVKVLAKLAARKDLVAGEILSANFSTGLVYEVMGKFEEAKKYFKKSAKGDFSTLSRSKLEDVDRESKQ